LTLVKYAGERFLFVMRLLLVPLMGGPRHVLEHVGDLSGSSLLRSSNDVVEYGRSWILPRNSQYGVSISASSGNNVS